MADATLPCALARRPRLLPNRAATLGRQRRSAHRRGSALSRRIHDDVAAGVARRDRHALLVSLHLVDAVGSVVAGADRSERDRSWLHGLGLPGLCFWRHISRQPRRPPADLAPFSQTALSGEL